MTKTKGFTLIELVVTLAVAALLITLAVPSFSTMLKNNRRTSIVNELLADINLARSEAVKRGSPVSLCPTNNYSAAVPTCSVTSDWHNGWIVFDDEGSSAPPTFGPTAEVDVIRRHHPVVINPNVIPLNPSIQSTGPLAPGLRYLAPGRAEAPNGALPAPTDLFFICDDRGDPQARSIAIERTGRVRVRDPITEPVPASTCP